ncbi:MAG: type I restriction endonuclease subunit R [Prevotella sp.]|jgi:type I restriction enzyme R subunit
MTDKDLLEKKLEADIEHYLITEGGYVKGNQATYDKTKAMDVDTLVKFINDTQPKAWEKFVRIYGSGAKAQLYKTLQGDIVKYGLIHTLRKGINDRGIELQICYFAPASTLNPELVEKYKKNILECTRQFVYSNDVKNSIDMVLSLNGIPVVAIELKNQFTGQDINDSIEQWKTSRNPKEPLFQFDNRILAYFGCDLYEAAMTTELKGEKTFFMPFNQGSNGAGNVGGAGNPQRDDGEYVTSYLWKDVLRRDVLLAILQRFIMRQEETKISLIVDKHGKEKEVKKTTTKIIFPRYHQLDVVEKLIGDTARQGAGKNYLIQHSAGSGKSNSIAWLTYRLASLHDKENKNIFKGVFVVTDRRLLNRQLQQTILGFEHVDGTVTTITEDDSNASQKLRDAINADKTGIVITTLQRFPQIYDQITKKSGECYAVVVDEAHSSQSGKSAEKLKAALADTDEALKEMAEWEDKTVEELEKEEDRLMLDLLSQGQHKNLSFYAFTATPKPKTLQTFGILAEKGETPDKDKYKAFHYYSMLQAIEEGFIMDVLKNYTTYQVSYEIARQSEDNPDYEETPATIALKAFHDNHQDTINKKTAIIVEKFREVTLHCMAGRAKAMVVTSSRAHAVRYFFAIKEYCQKHHITDVHPLVAFSGKVEYKGVEYTEPQLNKRGDKNISEDRLPLYFSSDFYNMLIVADKYQTGFDEPLLHTMFVDKKLKNVKAVQTLSRLNRAHPLKKDTYVFDFANTADEIKAAFEPFYKGTELIKPVDVNYVYQFHKDIELYHLWTTDDEEKFYELFAASEKDKGSKSRLGALSNFLKPIVDRFEELDEDTRFEVRSKIKNFVRFYAYMAQIARTFDRSLMKSYIFADYLYRVLPKNPRERVQLDKKVRLVNNSIKANDMVSISLSGDKPEIKGENPGASVKPDDTRDLLDNIIDKVNLMYRGEFSEADRVMVEGIFDHIQKHATKKMARQAAGNDENQFVDSIFPDIFGKAAQQCYTTQTDAYRKLFENQEFYQTLMKQMGHAIYERYREQEAKAYTLKNLQEKMIPEMRVDFAGVAGTERTLEEAFDWMIDVLKVRSIDKYNGLRETILTALFKLYCSPNTLTLAEKRTYLKALVTGYESYLKKLYFLITDKEVTDKDGDVEHASLSNALYYMRLNKLQYSSKPVDQKFAQYVDLLVKLRNDESHQAKSLDAKEVKLGIHVVTVMYMYVTFKNITELEMVENKFLVLDDLNKDMTVHNFLRDTVDVHSDISILGLAKEAILKLGEKYPAMSIADWTKLARKYAEKRVKLYELKDDEPINWKVAEE